MRQIEAKKITSVVAKLYIQSNMFLPEDVMRRINAAYSSETSDTARGILHELMENASLASKKSLPLCQDTGIAEIFIEMGSSAIISGGLILDAVNLGVARGCKEGYLRNSIVKDPFNRINTGDNTPADIHFTFVEGDKIKITLLAKGGGSENASALTMLNPSAGWSGVKDFVVNHVKQKGANACPPLVLGVAIGGSFSSVALNSKKALLLDITELSTDADTACHEQELLDSLNALNIGPMGLGGKATCLGLRILKAPCHIASLPCAVSMGCHSTRKMTEVI